MRPKFGIWLDTGRAEYRFSPRRLTRAKRWGVAILALAVGAIGVRSVYSQLGESSELDSLAATTSAAPAIDTGRAPAGALAMRSRHILAASSRRPSCSAARPK